MRLIEKLSTVDKPAITRLPTGEVKGIDELWDKLILNYIPKRDVILKWHDLLIGYVTSNQPTFAIRGYNSFPSKRYGELRRGFLTQTQGFSYFFTDNFFAAYIQKMAIDGFIPTLNEFKAVFNDRQFPSRFGMNTLEERELLAVKQGKDPKINAAGFKLAHIIPVGKEYCYCGQSFGSTYILENYFPKGDRNDWKIVHDASGDYYRRDIDAKPSAKQFAIAHFLRFVHPFNCFLCPKKTCEKNNKCSELAEYNLLLAYAHDYNLDKYGDQYREFLSYIMPKEGLGARLYNPTENDINVRYGLAINDTEKFSTNTNARLIVISSGNSGADLDKHVDMLIEYLTNPNTSFRKLEIKYLRIDSAARGGGFISKKIINSFGLEARHKGILAFYSLERLMNEADAVLKCTLLKLRQYLVNI